MNHWVYLFKHLSVVAENNGSLIVLVIQLGLLKLKGLSFSSALGPCDKTFHIQVLALILNPLYFLLWQWKCHFHRIYCHTKNWNSNLELDSKLIEDAVEGRWLYLWTLKFLPFVPSKACRGSILSLEYLFASVLIWGLLKVSQIFKLLGLSQNIDRRTRKGSLNIKIWHVFLRLDEVVLKTMHHSCPVCTWNRPSATFLFDKASLPFWSAGLV